jgi:hypothetical protein
MTEHHAGTIWKAILGLVDEVEELRSRLKDSAVGGPGSVRSEIRRRRAELRNLLDKEIRSGSLSEVPGERKLSIDDAEVLAILLRQYVDPVTPWLTGREVLARLTDDTFTKLSLIAVLGASSTLRAAGIVTTGRQKGGHDPLDVRFRLADAVASFFYGPGDGAEVEKPRKAPREPQPYLSNREYLLDLRALAEYCRRRAHAIFGSPDPAEPRPTRVERRHIEKRIRSIARHIEQDLVATKNPVRLPMVAFQKEFALTAEETLVVVDLLFAELFEGEPSLEAVELLQMVSRDEEDLLRRRKMFGPESALLARGIVVPREHPDEERETPLRLGLADWVKDRVLGEDTAGREIAPDERIDFHLYLRDLDSSARFYRDLAGGGDEGPSGQQSGGTR